MSTSFKCEFCDRNCLSRPGIARHINNCTKALEARIILTDNNVEDIELNDEEFNEQELELDEQEFDEEPNNNNQLRNYSDNFEYEFDNQPKNLDEPEDEFDNRLQNYSYNFEDELEDEFDNRLQNYSYNFENESELENESESEFMKLDEIEEPESETNEFPNNAYADLMNLVIKHNLNNKAGNAIIKFFNKHSNLSISPLPKNIESGRKFIDKISNKLLSYHKQLISEYNNVEYFLYYRPIKNCIQRLLSNSELSRLLLYKYESLKVNIIIFFFLNP
jgi:hypothetical protein